MDSGWIMCDSGIYPAEEKYQDGEETWWEPGETQVLILKLDGDMHFAYYYPAEKDEPAHWQTDEYNYPLDKVVCWRHKPAPPPGIEC